jgi:putative DNA-invertase from lambdoid prophage Rac
MARKSVSPTPSPANHRSPAIYGYCRVSTSEQADQGISLEEQQRKIEGRCLEMGWQLAEMFVEKGISGSIPFVDRPEGGRLLGQLQAGDIIVSPKLDRCFRSSIDALVTIQELKKRGVSLWLLDLGGDVSGNGISELMLTVLAAVSQFERTRIGERIRDARSHMRLQGKHLGGTRPFGYRLKPPAAGNGKGPLLVPDPAEQKAIKRMLKMRAEGKTLFAIRDAVRAMGHHISHETVRQVLARRSA